jgi:GNAT superfamily N-acetyltransferase
VQIEIREERELPSGITRLVEIGLEEGLAFTGRFVAEWKSGRNRFDRPGEVSLFAYLEGSLVGFGGLNRDPYQDRPSVGRVRHVYVEPAARGRGVGTALVRELVRRAAPAFATLRLATREAAPFYEQLGFARVSEHKATHRMSLTARATT